MPKFKLIFFVLTIYYCNGLLKGRDISGDYFETLENEKFDKNWDLLQSVNEEIMHELDLLNITYSDRDAEEDASRTDSYVFLNNYDYIVVGAGSAGCVIASRLSENPNVNVLLIEAGRRWPMAFTNIPILALQFLNTPQNWGYIAEPQKGACLGMKQHRCAFPRGKGVGGSSLINTMIYNRGNRYDFDQWAALGNSGWSYDEVLPYFKKSERNHLNGLENDPFHGTHGPWNIEYPRFRSEYVQAFMNAQKHLGYQYVDYNGRTQIGTSYVQTNTKFGRRHSAASAFIDPIYLSRKNLHIMSGTHVTKVLIDEGTKEAKGVQYVRYQKFGRVYARKEVILSAGVFNSPQLLMLSGIGPENHLKSFGIPLIKNLPVGKRLQDHNNFFSPTFTTNATGLSTSLDRSLKASVLKEYFLTGGTKLCTAGGVEALTFLKTPNSDKPHDVPDIELLFIPAALSSDSGTGVAKGMRIKETLYNTVFKPLDTPQQDVFTVMVMPFFQKSLGHIELNSSDPFDPPKIFPNYFSHPDDIENILYGIREATKIVQSPFFAQYDAKLHDIPLPNCKQHVFNSDNYWRCAIRTLAATQYHQVATNKMGLEMDPTAVVSPELKVHGIQKLRVADTSVIPLPTSGHTAAVAMMIGEKVSDMIKKDWE